MVILIMKSPSTSIYFIFFLNKMAFPQIFKSYISSCYRCLITIFGLLLVCYDMVFFLCCLCLIVAFGLSSICYDVILFIVLLLCFICIRTIQTCKTDLISRRYQIMVVNMLKNWSRRYSNY